MSQQFVHTVVHQAVMTIHSYVLKKWISVKFACVSTTHKALWRILRNLGHLASIVWLATILHTLYKWLISSFQRFRHPYEPNLRRENGDRTFSPKRQYKDITLNGVRTQEIIIWITPAVQIRTFLLLHILCSLNNTGITEFLTNHLYVSFTLGMICFWMWQLIQYFF
jgi:hypothetical protein